MELVKRDGDKKARRSALLIALVIHVILGVIFWNTGGSEIIKDFIMEVGVGQAGAPPPPPKPKMKQIKMKKPKAMQPKFSVSAAKVDPKFTPSFKVMSSFDSDVEGVDFSSMAQNFSTKSFSLDNSQIANVTGDILGAIGVGDIMGSGRGTKVSGVGKRMRARLNLCLVATPGVTVLGSDDVNDAAANQSVLWNYVFKKYNSIDRARAWLKENTQILVTENTITLNFDKTFSDWTRKIKKSGALAVDSGSYYKENTAIRRLEHAVEELEHDKINGSRVFKKYVDHAVFTYLGDKYEIKDIELLQENLILKKIEDRFLLRDWRKRGITKILKNSSRIKEGMTETQLFNLLKPLYLFFKTAQALENPLLIISNTVGLGKINIENLKILRTYVQNGGFIWIDDSGVASPNVNSQDLAARIFINTLMSFDQVPTLSTKEKKAFEKLTSEDKAVQGYMLGDPFPQFAHPKSYIPIIVPKNTPVDIRIFNRLGILVKQFNWTRSNPMKAGAYLKKELALAWSCDNNAEEPIESGNYFVQMQAGIYQKTKILRVSRLRQLDEKHPLMGVVHNFRNVPVCTVEKGSKYWVTRPYGNSAFGYYLKGRMSILYTEGAGVIAGLGDIKNPVGKDMASKFLNNVIAFCLSDEDGVAIRP